MEKHATIDMEKLRLLQNQTSSNTMDSDAPHQRTNSVEMRLRHAPSFFKSGARKLLEDIATRAEASRRRTGPTPSISVKQRGPQELELSVKLPVDWENVASTEEYEVQLYYFQPQNLASVDTNFYGDIVRMLSFKAPERSLIDLAGAGGTARGSPAGGSPRMGEQRQKPIDEEKDRIFRKLAEELETLKQLIVSPEEKAAEEKKLVEKLCNRIRTLGCLYRDALRSDTKLGVECLVGLIQGRKESLRLETFRSSSHPHHHPHHQPNYAAHSALNRPSNAPSPGVTDAAPSTSASSHPNKPGHRRAVSTTNIKHGPLSRVSLPFPLPPEAPGSLTPNRHSNVNLVQAGSEYPPSVATPPPPDLNPWTVTPLPQNHVPPPAANGASNGPPPLHLNGGLGPGIDEWLAELILLVEDFASAIEAALNRFFEVGPSFTASWLPEEVRMLWAHCEEFVLCVTEDACLRYMSKLEGSFPGLGYPPQIRDALCEPFVNLTMVIRRAKMRNCYVGELKEGHDLGNEGYNTRIHHLKSMMNSVLDLEHSNQRPSTVLVDFIGGFVAALAMFVAISFTWYGQVRLGLTSYDRPFIILVIISYILKDRIKVWGQRYYAFLVKRFGVMVPDHTIVLNDILGHRVGIVEEECTQTTSNKTPAEIVRMRNSHLPEDTRLLQGKMSREKVVVYKKAITLNWDSLERTVQEVSAVSDRTRIDLSPLLQRAEAPTESHFLLVDRPRASVKDVVEHRPAPDTGAATSLASSMSDSVSYRALAALSPDPLPAAWPMASPNHLVQPGPSYSSAGRPAFLASEFVTVKKVPCPRVYECAFVVKVRRKYGLGDQLKEGIQSGLGKVIRTIIGRGQRLHRALSTLPMLARGSSQGLRQDNYLVEVSKCFRVILDRNGVKRIVEMEGAREASVVSKTWKSFGALVSMGGDE